VAEIACGAREADRGADALTAEREAVAELGDPDRRAALSANRPMHLIGPTYFFRYLRLLKLLMSIVVPIAAAAVLVSVCRYCWHAKPSPGARPVDSDRALGKAIVTSARASQSTHPLG